MNTVVYTPHCPACDRPLVPFKAEHIRNSIYHDISRPPGDWSCLECPEFTNDQKGNRYFWSYRMPHPPETPDEIILSDIRCNLQHVMDHDKRSGMFSAWSTYAILFLLKKLGEDF